MQKAFILIFVVLFIVVVGELSYYFFFLLSRTPVAVATHVSPTIITSSVPTAAKTIPTPITSKNDITAIYQKPGDAAGRSILPKMDLH